jgi:uncharacterized phage protein (TIGR02218 family)
MMDIGLGDGLTAELTMLAICWKIVRQDGVALGFTTHDRPLVIGGMQYDSAPGMAPSAVVSSDGLDVDVMDVAGALSADAITAADLAAGRYDGAAVRLFMVDWRTPDGGQQVLARGTLGTIEVGTGPDAGFVAALRGPTAVLAATAIETYSPECRAELGDWRCRVSMRGRVVRGVVTTAEGAWIGVAGLAVDDLLAGQLRVLDGALAGIDRSVLAVEGDLLRLDEALAVPVGTQVEVRHGCDKQFSTCTGRFANGVNFRGEPHVPGGDVLTRFGGL